MPCSYCGGYEHALGDCPKAIKDRKADIVFSRIFIISSFPLWCLGSIVGMIYSAIKAGFVATHNLWESAISILRDKSEP